MSKSMERRRSRGVAALEFALILPFFIPMLLGMIDYGWYFYLNLVATNAAREGARAATTIPGGCPNNNALDLSRTTATNYLAVTNFSQYATTTATCTTTTPSPLSGPQPMFQVVVQLNFPRLTGTSLIPMPQAQGSPAGYVGLSARSTMRGVP